MATKLYEVVLSGFYRGMSATARWNRLGDGVWLLRVTLQKGVQKASSKTFRIHQRDAKPCWTVSLNYFASIYRPPKVLKDTGRLRRSLPEPLPAGAVVKFTRGAS